MNLIDYHSSLQFLFLNAFILIHIQCMNPVTKCLEKKLELGPKDPLIVEFFYVSKFGKNIEDDVCKVIKEFKGLVRIKYRFGALSTQGKNGVICGSYSCTPDRRSACRYKKIKNFDSCDQLPVFSLTEIGDCICQRKADYLLLENGEARENYGIDPTKLPTLVFGEQYDPCVDTSSAAKIKAYICEIYQGKAKPCK